MSTVPQPPVPGTVPTTPPYQFQPYQSLGIGSILDKLEQAPWMEGNICYLIGIGAIVFGIVMLVLRRLQPTDASLYIFGGAGFLGHRHAQGKVIQEQQNTQAVLRETAALIPQEKQ